MIEEPPLLVIETLKRWPSDEAVAAFTGRPTGQVVDALGGRGALPSEIKPLLPAHPRVCGPALPCDCGPADILALLAAFTELRPGAVIVQATGGWKGCAAAGDLAAGMAKNGGAAGLVTDGLMRDLDALEHVGLPVYAAGLSPNSPYGKGPGTVGQPVTIGDQVVGPGDIVVADRDGVVVVPFERIDETRVALERVAALEAAMEAEVKAGRKTPDGIAELVSGPQTRRV